MPSDISWSLMEEAVMRDRGYDEEQCLADMIRSYLSRRGLADTLNAFDAEWIRDRAASHSPNTAYHPATDGSGGGDEEDGAHAYAEFSEDVANRKKAQLLCLNDEYEAAAMMLPSTSVLRVKLLCTAADAIADSEHAMTFLAHHVAPLIPGCDNRHAAHALYMRSLTSILQGGPGPAPALVVAGPSSPRDDLAEEINDALLARCAPSAMNVLLSWADWQDGSKSFHHPIH